MNFVYFNKLVLKFDEIFIIGRTIERDEKYYHIIGMSRCGKRVKLYVLEMINSAEEHALKTGGRKPNMRRCIKESSHHVSYFMNICSVKLGEQQLEVECVNSISIGDVNANNYEYKFLFAEMIKAGWLLSENSIFYNKDWEELSLTEIEFSTEIDKFPTWENKDLIVKLNREIKAHFLEKTVTLKVGGKKKIAFPMDNGENGICYINKVYPIDIWKEQEEKFKDPRYLEHVSKEELENIKRHFYEVLEENCPKGMCYIGIEYECTDEVNLLFYSKEYLKSVTKEYEGSSSIMLMSLKPEPPFGYNGLKLRGCIIQTPVDAHVEKMKAELFQYVELIPEREDIL